MMAAVILLTIWLFAAAAMAFAVRSVAQEEQPRKHLSFPRRRFLRKRARKANVH